ncbi:MAG: acetoacetate decarboxylase family protein [Thermomicrobiales bacterium]
MPTTFGVAGGPRQAPGHDDFHEGPIKFTRHVVRFEGREEQISPLLPAGLSVRGKTVVNFQFFCLRDIPWLAGRGYNLLSMLIPVRHSSASGETVDGMYQAVMWENLGDPIITGREQLGHPKLYAQLPEPRHWNGKTYIRASWEDFTFAELELSCTEEPDARWLAGIMEGNGVGIISHKYIPRSGEWDKADADYLTLSPMPSGGNLRDPQPMPSIQKGTGKIKFNVPDWQDMPTQYHIVRQLAALDQIVPLDAFIMEGTIYLDFYDQRILS